MFTPTEFAGVTLFTPKIYTDERGSFREAYTQKLWEEAGFLIDFIQDNCSISHKNILRGLHFQIGEHAQTKLVRVTQGKARVAIVDLRKSQATFGKSFVITLDALEEKQLLVPKGFAHGFLSLEDYTNYNYKVDGYRVPEAEAGLDALDPALEIDWTVPTENLIRKDFDKSLPPFAKLSNLFD